MSFGMTISKKCVLKFLFPLCFNNALLEGELFGNTCCKFRTKSFKAKEDYRTKQFHSNSITLPVFIFGVGGVHLKMVQPYLRY